MEGMKDGLHEGRTYGMKEGGSDGIPTQESRGVESVQKAMPKTQLLVQSGSRERVHLPTNSPDPTPESQT